MFIKQFFSSRYYWTIVTKTRESYMICECVYYFISQSISVHLPHFTSSHFFPLLKTLCLYCDILSLGTEILSMSVNKCSNISIRHGPKNKNRSRIHDDHWNISIFHMNFHVAFWTFGRKWTFSGKWTKNEGMREA